MNHSRQPDMVPYSEGRSYIAIVW